MHEAERQFRLTRGCLEVAVEARQPVSLITKNALILRDLDLLRTLAAACLVHVNISVTTLDAILARSMEPRASTLCRRPIRPAVCVWRSETRSAAIRCAIFWSSTVWTWRDGRIVTPGSRPVCSSGATAVTERARIPAPAIAPV